MLQNKDVILGFYKIYARWRSVQIKSRVSTTQKMESNPTIKINRIVDYKCTDSTSLLYEYDYSQYEVMDGLQRLTAIREFYDNVFPLEGLDQWSELNGKTYNQLPEQVRKGIDRRYISSIILLKETAKTDADAQKLKQLVFERINSGGVHLSEQESRNALYPGCLNSLSIQLAENDKFKKCGLWMILRNRL